MITYPKERHGRYFLKRAKSHCQRWKLYNTDIKNALDRIKGQDSAKIKLLNLTSQQQELPKLKYGGGDIKQ